ncbi:retrovirus-related pol polyprotein from transposon TNT 1-94 [Tanacetum coccineum]
MNDFKRNKHFPEKIASNLKFLNNLQPEWSRHDTVVHQTKDLHTVDYTQLYDFLKYNQKEAECRESGCSESGCLECWKSEWGNCCSGIANQNRNGNVVAAQAEVIPRRRDAAYLQTQLVIAQKEEAGIQLQAKEFDLMAAVADLDEIEEVNANYILIANLQQALTLGTQSDKAPVYDSDESTELSKEKSTASSLQEEKKRLKSDFKIREDELLDKQMQLENKIKDIDNILVKMGQSIQTMHMLSPKLGSFYHTEHKMALGYPNPFYLKQAQQKQQSLYNGKVLLEKHDPPTVHDSEETLELAQERVDITTKTWIGLILEYTKIDRVLLRLRVVASRIKDSNLWVTHPGSTFDYVLVVQLWVLVIFNGIIPRQGFISWSGLGHNLYSVGQFVIQIQEAFEKHMFSQKSQRVDFVVYGINVFPLNFDTINDLARNDLVTGLPKFKYHKEHLCPSCEQGKSKRASHPPKPIPHTRQRLHLLHMDLCGPMRIASINGKRSTTSSSHYSSSVRTPQQNKVVERRNHTLVEAARTMLIFSRAPLFLWAEAIATACYTQNRSIIHRQFDKTPYELINGRKPDISFLHVFEALCYPRNDRKDIRKLGAKGDICFFICYSANSCAYIVYNRRTKKIIETMNVTFVELSAMAFEQSYLKLGLQSMTSGQISLGLDLPYAPSTITTQTPTEGELDLLFEAMYDDHVSGQPSAAPRTVLAAQAP